VACLVRAAELAERSTGADEDAVRLYLLARAAKPEERLVTERLLRLGARATVPADEGSPAVPPLVAAMRSLDTGRPADRATAETLLSSGARDFTTLRVAERLARPARSAPQLANALALTADVTSGTLALRALSALAAVVGWMLPEGDDLSPWDRLLTLGSRDAVVLDDLVRRTRGKVAAGDGPARMLAIEATRRRLESAGDDSERVLIRVELARLQHGAGTLREASQTCREALAIDPTSTGAAVLLALTASEMGDRPCAVLAASSLADVAKSMHARASLLRDAADLSAAQGDPKGAALLLERALEADPDAVLVAARLAQLQADQGAWSDLARALRRGLFAARSADAVVPMAAELAEVAKTHLKDPVLAIEALERSREIKSDHVPTLLLLAELYIGQRTWDEALRALGDVVACTSERGEKLIARVGRASILARVLDRPLDAEKELRAALELDPHELRALRALLALPIELTPKERAELLSRVVLSETRPRERLAGLLELARVRRDLGDEGGAEGALVEAAALAPDAAMLARLREAAGGSAEAAARILGRAVARARDAGAAPGAEWLASLGELELGLGRLDDAIEHFEDALRLEPYREPARLALARALSKKGRHETAAAALTPLLDSSGGGLVDVSFVRQLDEAFTGAGRTQQALVARELRAIAGDLDESGHASLRARRPAYVTNGEALSGSSLRSFVMPGGLGKHPIWDAASIAGGLAGKLARIGLTERGSSAKDRVKPKAVHPVRQVFDRLCRVFELFEVELAVSDHVMAPIVACEDAIWVVAPSTLGDWPEPHAIAALARPLARIALGIPWLGALSGEETLAIIVAFARQVAPGVKGLPQDRVEVLVGDYEARARRAIDRKKKRALDDHEDALARSSAVVVDAFVDAALRTEARAAFLLSGDLRASLDAVAMTEAGLGEALRTPGRVALAAVLSRPVARDLVAFAMGGDATALRRSLGTLWD
jgi:tetratricopeptide (TPR) repeat protein